MTSGSSPSRRAILLDREQRVMAAVGVLSWLGALAVLVIGRRR